MPIYANSLIHKMLPELNSLKSSQVPQPTLSNQLANQICPPKEQLMKIVKFYHKTSKLVNTKNPKIWHTPPCLTKNFWRWYNEFDCHFRRHCFRCHCYCCQDQWWKVKTIITDEAFCRLSIIIHLASDGTWVAMVVCSCIWNMFLFQIGCFAVFFQSFLVATWTVPVWWWGGWYLWCKNIYPFSGNFFIIVLYQ